MSFTFVLFPFSSPLIPFFSSSAPSYLMHYTLCILLSCDLLIFIYFLFIFFSSSSLLLFFFFSSSFLLLFFFFFFSSSPLLQNTDWRLYTQDRRSGNSLLTSQKKQWFSRSSSLTPLRMPTASSSMQNKISKSYP